MARVLAVLRGKRQTKRFQRTVYLLPSMFTVGTLFCGYACIVYAMQENYATAAIFIGVATVLDVLDGRIARLAGAASEFGGEFDSLADVISFGVAPAVLVLAWGLEPLGRLGWAVGFLYVTATALRLARFNVQTDTPDKRYCVGMPSPAAAGVLVSTVFAWPDGFGVPQAPVIALAMVLVPALMMVSRMRFRAFGALALRPRRSFLVLLQIPLLIAAIAVQPEPVLFFMAYSYLASGPIGFVVGRLRRSTARRGGRGGRDTTEVPTAQAG
ncbi:MAG: CDP-diacylglycerol--serine O-phosphatidyltransferase [Acidobacteria bacterium]|nr:MAG: CDP-diacylglycerol--serine O-phosphatidyltransferase [Acidobacteriota bacterium]